MPKSSSKPIDDLTFEAAFAELETIVAALEGEQSSLDISLALYERGQALVKRCGALLEKAELQVRKLAGAELTDLDED